MEWLTIITTLLPLILSLFDKGTKDPRQFRIWGKRFRNSADSDLAAFGEVLMCCAEDADMAAQQYEVFQMVRSEQVAKMAAAKEMEEVLA